MLGYVSYIYVIFIRTTTTARPNESVTRLKPRRHASLDVEAVMPMLDGLQQLGP